MEKELYTTGEVAEILGVAPDTVRRYCNSGMIKSQTGLLSTHRRIRRSDLEAFLEEKGIPRDALMQEIATRVLVADDDKNMRKIVTKTLHSMNIKMEVETAENGFEACLKAGNMKPHLMIVDLMMPGIKGFEVIKNIKEAEETSLVKVIVITAFSDNENIRSAENAGADTILKKPLNIEMLKDAVRELIK